MLQKFAWDQQKILMKHMFFIARYSAFVTLFIPTVFSHAKLPFLREGAIYGGKLRQAICSDIIVLLCVSADCDGRKLGCVNSPCRVDILHGPGGACIRI